MRAPLAALLGASIAVSWFSIALLACGPSVGIDDDDDDSSDDDDDDDRADARTAIDAAPPIDATSAYADAPVYGDGGNCSGWECANPVDDGCDLGGQDVCGNGLDDDCNGEVDDGCNCVPGAVQPCFQGPPGKRGIGSCVDGQQTCFGPEEFGTWGDCGGGISPGAEACDGQDNDCNGCGDDNPSCCVVDLACPGPGDMPDGAPFDNYVIDGTAFFGGTAISWSWEVTGGPCDQLLEASSGNVSFDLIGQNTSMLTFHPTLSGDYTVHVTIVTSTGTLECTFIVHIVGPGLRVEACWDTTGSVDLDLHLHQPDTTTNWFVHPQDCGWNSCSATDAANGSDWGYAPSPLSECVGGPEGAAWALIGACRNPRLDVDNIATAGIPENINVDNPVDGKTYRVALNYYGGLLTTHPMVNIYCGGFLLGSYGAAPDTLANFNIGGGDGGGQLWRVVDVTPTVVGGVTTGCTLDALHPPGTTTGYYVTNGNSVY